MKIFQKKRPICEISVCDNFLPKDPAKIVLDEHEYTICDECCNLMQTIMEKFEEREENEQSL